MLENCRGHLTLRSRFGALAVVLACGWLPCAATADDFTDRVNKPLADISASRRSDPVLLPKIAAIAPPPKSVATLETSATLPPGKSGWSEAESWVTGAPQKEALAALQAITKEHDAKNAFAFGLPYGIDGVEPSLVQAGMYADLGDPPTLAGARLLYLPALDRLAIVANVEATRLTAAGQVNDAIDVLTNFVYFARQMCDRPMFTEAAWGLWHMCVGFERIRDVVYTDSLTTRKLDVGRLRDQIKALGETGQFLDLSRMKFPQGNQAAAEQLVARLYKPDGNIDEGAFAATMSRLGSSKHPLRLFSESGRWRSIASTQDRKAQVAEKVRGVFDDWNNRWNLKSRFDPKMSVASTFSQMDASSNSIITTAAPDLGVLLDLRDLARVEGIGTRNALGIMGFATINKSFPPQLAAIKPAWVPSLEADPFNNTNLTRGGVPPLEYFVPMSQAAAAFDGAGSPHKMKVFAAGANFEVSLRGDVFVLYSWGSDLEKNNANSVENVAKRVEGADYLMWPPVLSLLRQHKIDVGEIK